MVWFLVDDTLAAHPKTQIAGLEAMGLWTLAGSWSCQQLTDGHVPGWFVRTIPRGKRLAYSLVTAGFWHEPGHVCPRCPQPADGGWIFHDWPESRTREHVLADRKAAAERQAKHRQKSNGVTDAERNGVTHTVSHTTQAVTRPDVPTEHLKTRVRATSSTTNDRVQQGLDLAAKWDRIDAGEEPPPLALPGGAP